MTLLAIIFGGLMCLSRELWCKGGGTYERLNVGNVSLHVSKLNCKYEMATFFFFISEKVMSKFTEKIPQLSRAMINSSKYTIEGT